MDRDKLLIMLGRASNLLHEDDALITETRDTLNRMLETQNNIISISNKRYNRLTKEEYDQKNPFTFTESTPPEHKTTVGKIGIIVLVVGIIISLLRLIIGPIMFFRAKALIRNDPWADLTHTGYNLFERIFARNMKFYAHASFIGMLISTVVIVIGMVIITGLIYFILTLIQSKISKKNQMKDMQMLAPLDAERRKREEHEHYERFLAEQRDYDQKISNAIQNDKAQIQRLMQTLDGYKVKCINNANRHKEIWAEFDRDILPFYPPDYVYPEAVDAFYNYVRNMAASTIQEAVNRYLDDKQHEKTRDLIRIQIKEGRENADRTIQAITNSSNQLKTIISEATGKVTDAVNEQTNVVNVRTQILSDQIMLQQVQHICTAIEEAQHHYESMRKIGEIRNGLATGYYI